MLEWITSDPWRAVCLGGLALAQVLGVVGAAVRAGWPDSPWGRALAAAQHALPANLAGMMGAAKTPAATEVKP